MHYNVIYEIDDEVYHVFREIMERLCEMFRCNERQVHILHIVSFNNNLNGVMKVQ